jgi:ketosteroid isomerase-like protein
VLPGEARSSGTDDSISAVRAQRAESNAAIAAHDAVRLRKLFDDDYHAILSSMGNIDSGGDAAIRGYADEEFKDQTFVTYRRTPTSIVIAASGKRIAETGRFEGVWRKRDGTMQRTGVYLAMWIPSAGSWRLKSEAFVTLGCTGSAACDRTG